MADDLLLTDPEVQEKAQKHLEEETKSSDRKALTARTVHKTLLKEGEEELDRTSAALGWSGLAAGASMGLSLVIQGALKHHLPDTSWEKLVTSLGYPAGFIAVTLGRQQLYTETTLTAFLPFLDRKRTDVLLNVLRLWVVVLIANMVGAFLFAWAGAWTTTFSPELSRTFIEIGTHEVRHDFATAFVKAVFGGWMIALVVWLMPSSDTAKIWVIAVITYALAVSELTHIVAGSVDIMFAALSGAVPWSTYFWQFFLPVLLGNTIGGVVFVATLNHAQVESEAK